MDTADVMIHVDETLEHERRAQIVDLVSAHIGAEVARYSDEKPHLMIVKYDPLRVTSGDLLQIVLDEGVHAELIGL